MKLEIDEFVCHRVTVGNPGYGSTYLRITDPSLPRGLWYVSTRTGFELFPDKEVEALEAAFKQEREVKGILQ